MEHMEATGKSTKNPLYLYVLLYAKKHLSDWSNIEQQKNHVKLRTIVWKSVG